MKIDMRKLSLVIWLRPLLRMTSPGKMAGIMVTLLLMIVPVNEVSAEVVEEWVARWVTGYRWLNIMPQVGLDSNGNVYVLGKVGNGSYIRKYNPDGTQLWDVNPGGSWRAIEVDAAGNVYYAATVSTGPGYSVDIFKYNTNGNQVWTTRADVGTRPVGSIIDIALDANSNMIVVGDIFGPKNDPDDFYDENRNYYIIKFDANGDKLWAHTIGRGDDDFKYNDFPEALAVDPSGNIYVTGRSGVGRLMSSSRYFTVKLDANSSFGWSATYRSPHAYGTRFSEAYGIAVDSGGNAYITGMSRGIGQYDWATVKYDTNGNELWVVRLEGAGWDRADVIAVDNNSNVYVTGSIGGMGCGTVKYDTNGNQLWQSTYAASFPDMALDAQGNVYVTGRSQDDYATVGYNTNGNELWSIRYNGTSETGDDWPFSIGVDNNGNVYVTGISDSSEGNEDIVTIKYSQEDVGNTPTGSNIQVTEGDVTITFDTVTTAGDTAATGSGTGHDPPAGFQTCVPAVYYDISTTATYSGTIKICVSYDDSVCDESNLHLLHYEGGTWVDVTTSVDTKANIICGEVTSLSEFLLATYIGPIFVDADATGAKNNGTSWADAYKYLQDALAKAVSGNEILVAEGKYRPDRGRGQKLGDQTATFQLINGVAIKGGYGGFGEADPNVRDIDAYRTILSGVLGKVLPPKPPVKSYHVVTGSGTDGTAILDGFTIAGGNANGKGIDMCGGGMINESKGNPTITKCTFLGNSAHSGGGGMYNGDYSAPTLISCTFRGNSAEDGGGMFNYAFSSPTLTNCTFSGNTATSDGGGMFNTKGCEPTVSNCILWYNSADLSDDEIVNKSSTPTISSSDIEDCLGKGRVWDSALGIDGGGNIDVKPRFVSASDLHLQASSACIDVGDNSAVTEATDVDGLTRIVDGDCDDTEVVDMGAYEFNYTNMGDFDYDCDVDSRDFTILGLAWWTAVGEAGWNPDCDISILADYYIDWRDVGVFADNWLTGL